MEHAMAGFNHGWPCYVKNMSLGPQWQQKPRPMASAFVYLSPLCHGFNIAWPTIIKTYNKIELRPQNYLHQYDSIMRVIYQSSCFTVLFGLSQLHS